MDKLEAIFERQAKYLKSLAPTYIHNGFLRHASVFPWDLDDRHYQEEFRLLAWRFTEELVEAAEVYQTIHPANQGKALYREEVSDALHFLIELCLVSGVSQNELLSGIPLCEKYEPGTGDSNINVVGMDSLDWFFHFISKEVLLPYEEPWAQVGRAIALAMMKLRQRPWRVDHRPTDRRQWVIGLHLTFQTFVAACKRTEITSEILYHAYFNKAKVNDQRREEFGA